MQVAFEKAVAEKNVKITEYKKIDAKISTKTSEIKRVEDNLL